MESTTTRQFREAFAALPPEIQKRVRDAYFLFKQNHNHPSLRFKKVHTTLPIYSARVTLDYRAVGAVQDDAVVWFWVGSHTDYERVLSTL